MRKPRFAAILALCGAQITHRDVGNFGAYKETVFRESNRSTRNDPNREKSRSDLERIEAAKIKRERKAALKLKNGGAK